MTLRMNCKVIHLLTQENAGIILIYKIGIIFFLFILTFIFGYLPIKISYFTKNYKLIGIANSFSGGIFLCVSLLHLLPESTEIFDDYLEKKFSNKNKSTHEKQFPISFVLAFCGYTIILMIEKIIFDNHTHQIENQQLEEEEFQNDDTFDGQGRDTNKKKPSFNIPFSQSGYQGDTSQISKLTSIANFNLVRENEKQERNFNPNQIIPRYSKNLKNSIKNGSISITSTKKDKINNYLDTYKKDIGNREENFKNLFATTGKISSLLLVNDRARKRDSRSSLVIKEGLLKSFRFEEDKINIMNNKISLINEEPRLSTKESITSYLLLLALSIHACFEGIAIGLQDNASEIFYMFLAITFHKWVEALSIGINLGNSNIERAYLFKYIILFSLMTPLGMCLGIFFSGFSELVEGTFLAISAGSFIYISSSEIVIEEFSVSKFKKEKFVGFVTGAMLVCLLTIFEHH